MSSRIACDWYAMEVVGGEWRNVVCPETVHVSNTEGWTLSGTGDGLDYCPNHDAFRCSDCGEYNLDTMRCPDVKHECVDCCGDPDH